MEPNDNPENIQWRLTVSQGKTVILTKPSPPRAHNLAFNCKGKMGKERAGIGWLAWLAGWQILSSHHCRPLMRTGQVWALGLSKGQHCTWLVSSWLRCQWDRSNSDDHSGFRHSPVLGPLGSEQSGRLPPTPTQPGTSTSVHSLRFILML